MKETMYSLAALLLLLSSYKSKKNPVSSIARPVLNTDSIRSDSSDVVTRLSAPDTPGLKRLSARRKAAEKGQIVSSGITRSVPPVVARGTNVTNSAVSVSFVYPGIDRAERYELTHHDVPEAFSGFRIAFTLSLHYKSLFKRKGLESLVRLLNVQHTDILPMGGDYQEGCQFVSELFAASAKVKTPLGTYDVIGNNDYEHCHDEIIRRTKRYGMRPLEHQPDTLRRDGEQIILTGIRGPSGLANSDVSPTLSLSPADFAILSVHIPDCAGDVSVVNSDLVLAGHTHGGQVRIFGYTPIIPPHYGSRLLTESKYNSAKIPMTVANGIGTPNKNIRIGAPAEIVMIILYRLRNEQFQFSYTQSGEGNSTHPFRQPGFDG